MEDATGPCPCDLPRWNAVDQANWSCPADLPGDRAPADHPVTHVTHADTTAHAAWVGGRSPTAPKWEHAARGDRVDARYPWGDAEPDDDGSIFCNIWQGELPDENTVRDGFYVTAPVDAFAPNPHGLFNMSGTPHDLQRAFSAAFLPAATGPGPGLIGLHAAWRCPWPW